MSVKVEQDVLLNATPERVFRALTEPAELERWFAEHAAISVDDNRYDFWGRYTPETPDAADGRHPLREVEPDRRLAFDWRLKGQDTRVTVTLEPSTGGTRLSLVHDHLVPYASGDWALSDFWYASLENLRGLLERGAVARRLDFTEIARERLELDYDIDAPAEAVFDALVDPEQLTKYLPHEADVDARVGGALDFHWGGVGPQKVLELDPGRKLAYSWIPKQDAPETVVTWELEESGGRTRLTLVHSGFVDDGPGHWGGWIAALNAMKNVLESRGEWHRIQESSRDC